MTARLLSALALALLVACGSADEASAPAVTNPMFERWCAEHPCDWDFEGEAKQVGTWHPDDYGVELLSDGAAISQLRSDLTQARSACFAFSLMAHVPEDAQAFLELDFLDDGDIDFSERIPTSNWEVRTFTIKTPTWFEGVRFRVRKVGAPRVIVAELNVDLESQGCLGSPLPLVNRPSGAKCEADDECTSGSCSMSAPMSAPLTSPSPGRTCD